jgi:hypothetical protein
VKSADGVKVLAAIVDADGTTPLKNGAGSTEMSMTDSTATTDPVFYAYTTSTTAGSVAITANGNTTVYYVVGTAGAAYNIVKPVFPSVITAGTGTSTTERVSFQVTDVFGNTLTSVVDGTNADQVDVAALGATAGAVTYSTVRKQFEATVYASTSTTIALSIAINATDLSANGWPEPVKSAFSTVSAGDLAAQVKSLTATVASLQTALAATVTKAKYNNLVKRFNKITKGKKAKLVK